MIRVVYTFIQKVKSLPMTSNEKLSQPRQETELIHPSGLQQKQIGCAYPKGSFPESLVPRSLDPLFVKSFELTRCICMELSLELCLATGTCNSREVLNKESSLHSCNTIFDYGRRLSCLSEHRLASLLHTVLYQCNAKNKVA